MNKTMLLAVVLLTGITAKADVFKCSFTEPFITYTYTTGTQTLKIQAAGEPAKSLQAGFIVRGPGQFEIVSGKTVILSMTLDNQGSDGMSDSVYPYSVKAPAMTGANSGIGGCESLALKKSGNGN